MKKYTHVAFTLLLGTFVVLGLSACAEGDSGMNADSTAMGTDTTAMGSRGGMQSGMQSDSVSLQSTSQMLQRGITQLSMQTAVQNISSWQQKLKNTQVQGQAKQAVSDIGNTLGQLKSTLQGGGQPPADQVGQAFQKLGTQMQTLMDNAQNLNLKSMQQQQLTQMQQAFQKTSQQLMNMGGGDESM